MINATSATPVQDAWGFHFASLAGTPMPLAEWRGKVLLVVNTASRCGFTRQYAALQKLYEEYQDRGLVVIGVPSSDFGQQEPGDAAAIRDFCEVNFGITFPITDKVSVKGQGAHPFYQWTAATLGSRSRPRWNFHKYLIGRDGQPIDYWSGLTSPDNPKVQRAVETALAAKIPG